MKDVFAEERKEKRWLIFQKVYVEHGGQIIEPGAGYPLQVQVKAPEYSAGQYEPGVFVAVTGDPWVLSEEVGSFDLAKQRVIELAKDIGLNKVKLTRAVDLHTVLYPIS